LLNIARTEGRVEDEGWRVRKDGSLFWADVVITALRNEQGQTVGFAKVTRDLTDRRQAEQDRARRMAAERAAQTFERLQAATAALAAASDPKTVAELLADAAMRQVGAASAAVTLRTPDAPSLETLGMCGDSSIAPQIEIPLTLDQRSLGVIGLGFRNGRVLDPDERGFLLALGEVGAQALDRARVYAAEQLARTEAQAAARLARDETAVVETLHRVNLALSAELDPDKVVQAVIDAARSVTGAEFASFTAEPATVEQGDPSFGSYLMVPVNSKSGNPLGTLHLGHREPNVFTERARRLAGGIAAQAAVALDNARLYREVQEAVRTRDEFLAAAAHDLKTPLATTKAVAQLLKNRVDRQQVPGTERLTEGLSRIDRSVQRMTGLIDELLDLARMQMGRPLDLDLHEVDLSVLMRDVLDDHRPNAPRHALRLVPSDDPVVARVDPVRIQRAFDNLVANAIKFSPAGGEVVVHIDSSLCDGVRVASVRVSDQGVGIPAADLPYVFERFRRGGNVAFIHGTGIGLGIAQSIVRQHGGSLSVESLEGKGSTFAVRLPLD
jgi:signal transduction histidine kinase